MSELIALFLNNILPILLAASTGYLGGKYLKLDYRPISQVAFYIFSPCLIFSVLNNSSLEQGDFSRMVIFTILTVLGVGLVALAAGLLLRLERRLLVAVLITTMFCNAGNYGLSLNLFAFGPSSLPYASLYYATNAILMYTLGVAIASLGKSSLRDALLGILKVPVIYAVVLALAFNSLHWSLPIPLARAIDIMGEGAIPMLMLLMGLQLQRHRITEQRLALGLSNIIRLAVSPAIGLLVAVMLGLQGVARQAGISEASTPTAIVVTVLASEYDVEPAFVTTAVFLSTLLSPLTITPLLAFLGA